MRVSARVLLALLALNGVLLAIGASFGGESRPRGDGPRIGLVFDIGGLGDKSFNDSANRGLERAAAELGARTHYIEPGDGSDREGALRQFASAGYDLVIGVGFIFSDDMRKLAAEFPAVKFACVDYTPPPPDTPSLQNLAGLRFREHEGSFLVGAIAGLTTKSKKVGFIGGMKIPLIRKFELGFAAGVHHVCPSCGVRTAFAGNTGKGFADPTKGKELALAQYTRGVDIIYHAAGKTGSGVFSAAREAGARAIGVDSDQYSEAPCCVLTSMIKNVDVAVFDIIADVAAGRFRGGVREFGLAEEGVDYVYDEHNHEAISPEVRARVEELRRAIVAGEIEVPSR